jgi:predicted nuclease with TOPRIM domain
MADVSNLLSRIDAEFTALDDRIKKLQVGQAQEYQERQKRLETFTRVLDEMRDVWRPRLEALMSRFGERVQVTPGSPHRPGKGPSSSSPSWRASA